MNLRKAFTLIALLAVSACFAQVKVTRRYGTTETMNKVRPGMAINSQDRTFFKYALETNILEAKLGALAARRGSTDWTREYGKMMMTEHNMGFNELKVIGGKLRLPVSKKLSSTNQRMIDRMARLSGAAFDREYREMMMKGHMGYLNKVEQEVKYGNNSLIRNHAITAGPVVRLHAKMAERRVTKL
jgi:putative membrane protein